MQRKQSCYEEVKVIETSASHKLSELEDSGMMSLKHWKKACQLRCFTYTKYLLKNEDKDILGQKSWENSLPTDQEHKKL